MRVKFDVAKYMKMSSYEKIKYLYPDAPEDLVLKAVEIFDEAMEQTLDAETFSTGCSIQATDEVRALMKDYINEQD